MSTTYTIDQKKWEKLSIFEQMGNIYSEVGRSFNSKRRGNDVDSQAAIYRAIDLFDTTIEILNSNKSPKSKEVLIAKEQFIDVINQPELDEEAVASLERYFLQFAIAARLKC